MIVDGVAGRGGLIHLVAQVGGLQQFSGALQTRCS
jgi:hypothetical protein